jgi:hypothetical protein
MTNLNLEEKIQKLKDRIADCREYISSDFCNNCISIYKEIEVLRKELNDLENERNR